MPSPRRNPARSARRVSARTKVVWGALLGAMTVAGGTLLALDPRHTPSGEGLSLPALVATTAPNSVDVIFQTTAPLDARRWQSIVIHDSGSPSGSASSLDADAKRAGLRGLGYHFVIGNGNGMSDGELHVGGRWMQQAPGAHVAGPNADAYNRTSIGICLVGDGERRPFTPDQLRRLVQLVDALRQEFKVPADRVVLNSQITGTRSPGRYFPEQAFRAQMTGR